MHKRPLRWLFDREHYTKFLYRLPCYWCDGVITTSNQNRKYHWDCWIRSLFRG